MTISEIKAKATPELMKKAQACKTPEELVETAKEYEIELTLAQAKEIYLFMH